ncbi:TonB-dependent receptor [Colwellia sp. 12G3]|uniref:TonB-dependent receptor n=1 Tax=Colwellia sp. 12G3 TaxID=2058299 RepID=UPI000C32C32E|nr:hypothetical protein CXF71_19505 [Colwellia sp. 12G3]
MSYNFRTELSTAVGEEITDDYGQWDINVAFNVTDYLSTVFEGINVTNEIIYTYDRNEYAPIGIYKNGRRYYTGLRVGF